MSRNKPSSKNDDHSVEVSIQKIIMNTTKNISKKTRSAGPNKAMNHFNETYQLARIISHSINMSNQSLLVCANYLPVFLEANQCINTINLVLLNSACKFYRISSMLSFFTVKMPVNKKENLVSKLLYVWVEFINLFIMECWNNASDSVSFYKCKLTKQLRRTFLKYLFCKWRSCLI